MREEMTMDEKQYPEPGSPEFEDTRRAVAHELGWRVKDVMDCEVLSYLDQCMADEADERRTRANTMRLDRT